LIRPDNELDPVGCGCVDSTGHGSFCTAITLGVVVVDVGAWPNVGITCTTGVAGVGAGAGAAAEFTGTGSPAN
jgi:hypothetical protein